MNIPKEIQDNLITYLEAAWAALADADIFDHLAETLDISDEEMTRLRDALEHYLNAED